MYQLLKLQEIGGVQGKFYLCASIAPGVLCLKSGSNPSAFTFDSVSSKWGVMFFKLSCALW